VAVSHAAYPAPGIATHVAMESTGVLSKPVWNRVEGRLRAKIAELTWTPLNGE
jgi:hypothetical protein